MLNFNQFFNLEYSTKFRENFSKISAKFDEKFWKTAIFVKNSTKIRKKSTSFCRNFEIWAVRRNDNLVDIEKCWKMRLLSRFGGMRYGVSTPHPPSPGHGSTSAISTAKVSRGPPTSRESGRGRETTCGRPSQRNNINSPTRHEFEFLSPEKREL